MDFDVTVEIPKGHRNKYEVDHATGRIRLDRTLFTATQYPADYGFIEGTLGAGRRPAGRAGADPGADVPGLPDPVPGDRHVPDDRREGPRRQGPLRALRGPAPGAPARHPPPRRVRPPGDPALLRRSTRTWSRASRSRARPGSAGSRPRRRSARRSSAPGGSRGRTTTPTDHVGRGCDCDGPARPAGVRPSTGVSREAADPVVEAEHRAGHRDHRRPRPAVSSRSAARPRYGDGGRCGVRRAGRDRTSASSQRRRRPAPSSPASSAPAEQPAPEHGERRSARRAPAAPAGAVSRTAASAAAAPPPTTATSTRPATPAGRHQHERRATAHSTACPISMPVSSSSVRVTAAKTVPRSGRSRAASSALRPARR